MQYTSINFYFSIIITGQRKPGRPRKIMKLPKLQNYLNINWPYHLRSKFQNFSNNIFIHNVQYYISTFFNSLTLIFIQGRQKVIKSEDKKPITGEKLKRKKLNLKRKRLQKVVKLEKKPLIADDNENKEDIRKFECPNYGCTRRYLNKQNLNRHLKFECGIEPRFKCGHCDYATRYPREANNHSVKIHKGLKPLIYDRGEQEIRDTFWEPEVVMS